MEIHYDDKKVADLFKDFTKMVKKKGPEITRVVKKRYLELQAADSFLIYLKKRARKTTFTYGRQSRMLWG